MSEPDTRPGTITYVPETTATITWEGLELPASYKGRNGMLCWKPPPYTRLVDSKPELTTYADAVARQRAVYEEEGVFRNNYFFLKTLLTKERKRVCKPYKKAWLASRKRDWANRYKNKERKAYMAAWRPYAEALEVNRDEWADYQALYAPEMERIKNAIETLHEIKEAMRKEAERKRKKQAAEKARRKAEKEAKKRAASPHYDEHVRQGEERRKKALAESERRRRDAIAKMQQMTDEEFAQFMSKEGQMLLEQGHSKKAVNTYILQEIKAHRKRMAKWRASGKPLGEWA